MDIVIVDADEGIESYYKAIFEAEFRGLNTKFFTHAEPVLDYLKDQTCDLVITDAALPDLDIFTFLDKLCERRAPVIVVSSDTSERLIVECLRSGAMDFLSKQEIKLGIFPRLLTRAFLEADRWGRLQEIARSLPHRPEYFKVNDEVRSFLAHEKDE
ncbi:MAG: response regulator, partial [Spirochaetia bacterium]|nr:response regulator [Spirochaetia bacterium]